MKYFLGIVFQITLLLLCLFSISIEGHGSDSWLFKASHTIVNDGKSEGVSLTCRYDNDNNNNTIDNDNNNNNNNNNRHENDNNNILDNDNINNTNNNDHNDQPRIKEVTRISILKLHLDPNKPWTTYAKVDDANRPAVLVHPGGDRVTAHGLAGQVAQSYLSVTWEMTSQDTVGTYMCQVEGYTDIERYVLFGTPTVTLRNPRLESPGSLALIVEYETKADALGIQSDESQRLANTLQRKSNVLQRESQAIYSNAVSFLQYYANQHGGKLRSWLTTTTQPPKRITQPTTQAPRTSATQWPRGMFALLKTSSGCPKSKNGERWMDGYVRFHTESSRGVTPNDDCVSHPRHMPVATLQRHDNSNLFNMRICKQHNARAKSVPVWPKGSYCLIDGGGGLLNGFREGYIWVDMENDRPSKFEDDNGPLVSGHGTDIKVYFMCRNDADHSIPINLPVETPFYLLRRGGRCQQVLNADVTEESFTLDTEDDENKDKSFKRPPDLTLNPIVIHTCYYQKHV